MLRRIGKCYSQGSIIAPIYILAEAPGAEEVSLHVGRKGKFTMGKEDFVKCPTPFVGPAGRLLRRIMRWANIEEGDYILSNSVSYWPVEEKKDKSRTPNEEEIMKEKPRVIEEITKICPKLIITVGKVPLWQLVLCEDFPTMRGVHISEYVGRLHHVTIKSSEYRVLPLYHTSYILRAAATRDRHNVNPGEAVADAIRSNREVIEEAVGRPLLIGGKD